MALQANNVRHLRYLPLTELTNEGPGYGYDMLTHSLLIANRVEIIYGEPRAGDSRE